MRATRAMRVLRWLVLVLIVPVALSFSLPAFARVVAGPPVHVCHCELRHGHGHEGESTCACPKCFPDREELGFSEDALRGHCGDAPEALRDTKFLDVGVSARPHVVLPASTLFAPSVERPELRSEPPVAPPRKPPKPTLA